MSDEAKWFYASASPYAESGGMPSVKTTKADYLELLVDDRATLPAGAFKPASTQSMLQKCFVFLLVPHRNCAVDFNSSA